MKKKIQISDSLCCSFQVVQVSTLYHKIWDYPAKEAFRNCQIDQSPVKSGAVVSISWAPSAKCNEIFAGFRYLSCGEKH